MMNRKNLKRTLTSLLMIPALFVGTMSLSANDAEAGFFSDAWYASFGPPTNYYGGYAPAYRTGYRYGAYYAPAFNPYCRPTCSPCNTCNPCDTCGPCGTGGPCTVAKTTGKLTPEKDNGVPKTFKNGEAESNPPQPMEKPEGDSKFDKRDATNKFAPTRKKAKEEDAPTFPKTDGNESGTQKTNKVPEPPESLIKKKQPAPAKSAVGDEDKNKETTEPAKKVEKPKTTEKTSDDGPTIPKLQLDGKITWRTAPQRTRLVIRSRVEVPTVARTTVDPNRKWTPVTRGTRIVSK